MSKGTKLRNVRISDELWIPVQIEAQRDQRTVSDVVRELLTEWIEKRQQHD